MLFQIKIDEERLSNAWKRTKGAAHVLLRYILALLVASFLSLSYLAKYESGDIASEQPAVSAAEPQALLAALSALVEGSHPAQPLPQVLLKVSVVIAISILWFLTFVVANDVRHLAETSESLKDRPRIVKLTRWLMIAGAVLPAIPFILSMRGAYEPAVFVMALVAIFMAAEHYGGLRESKQELEEKTREIGEQIDLVLNADGLAQWRAELYGLYCSATRRIDAVIRYFDVDEAWWRCARSETAWQDYEDLSKDAPDTLFGALNSEKCTANIQFVCDFPMPFRGSQPAGRLQRAAYFRSFLGLTFNLVLFEKIRQRRSLGKTGEIGNDDDLTSRFFPYARVIVSHAPSWMHVIDDVVFQVIERGKAEDSTVRRLTLGAINPNTRVALNEWARRNVRQFAHRGTRAEEHVCAVLRYQAIKNPEVKERAPLNDWALKAILNDLGMGEFLSLPNGEFRILPLGDAPNKQHEGRGSVLMSHSEAEDACVAVFTEFLAQRLSKGVLAVTAPTSDPPQVRELIYEVL